MTNTSYSKKDKEKWIQIYEEEMAANLQLYTSGKDDAAYERYKTLAEYVRTLRSK